MMDVLFRVAMSACLAGFPGTQSRNLRVVRCTLNGQPRIAAVALHPEMIVAFDTVECRLAWAWKGSLDYKDWTTTGRRGEGPTVGLTRWYYQASDTSVWTVEQEGQPVFPALRYKGYSFAEESIVFHFSLILPGDKVINGETTIQAHVSDAGDLVLQQRLEFKNMPPKTRIRMPLRGEIPWDRFETLGTQGTSVDRESYVVTFKKDGYSICGFAFNF
jgi:hypothetical protein